MRDSNTQEQPRSGGRLRAMYPGGRAGPAARRLSRLWAVVYGLGLPPQRWVTLEVAGRRSGRVTLFPLGDGRLAGRVPGADARREDRRTTLAREGSS